jgi:hypothetical protein
MEDFINNQQIPLVKVIDPNTGREYYSPENTTYDKNYPGPTTLRGVIVDQAISSSYALTASYASNTTLIDTGSLILSASFTDPNLIFIKGNGGTFNVNLSTLTVINAYTASYINGGTF